MDSMWVGAGLLTFPSAFGLVPGQAMQVLVAKALRQIDNCGSQCRPERWHPHLQQTWEGPWETTEN